MILSAVNVDVEEVVDAVDDAEVDDDEEDVNDEAIIGVFIVSRFSRDKVRRITSSADSVFVVAGLVFVVSTIVLVIGREEALCKTLVFVFFFCCCFSNSLFVKACR